jgi:hypothetical protein
MSGPSAQDLRDAPAAPPAATDARRGWDAALSTPGDPLCAPEWLALREPADAAARAPELVDQLRAHLPDGPLVVRDLGCGTGSMGRWLAGQLPGPQHWVLHDRDPVVLERAAASLPAEVTVDTRLGDLSGLQLEELEGTSLVVASALLDLLTAGDVERLATVCTAAGCPALLTLSVVGDVLITPSDPLDRAFAAAFNAHQRRVAGGRRLLGPDAVATAGAAFRWRGARVMTAGSPWRLGPSDAALAEEWMRGWLAAACEQEPALAADAGAYLERRLAAAARGELRVVVRHTDLLALPGAPFEDAS